MERGFKKIQIPSPLKVKYFSTKATYLNYGKKSKTIKKIYI